MNKYELMFQIAKLLIFAFAVDESLKRLGKLWGEFRADQLAKRLRLVRCVTFAALFLIGMGPGLYYGLEVLDDLLNHFGPIKA